MVASLARLRLMAHVTAHRIDPAGRAALCLFSQSRKPPLALRPGMLIGALSFGFVRPAARALQPPCQDAKYRDQQALSPAGLIKTEPFGAIILPSIEVCSIYSFLTTFDDSPRRRVPILALVLLVVRMISAPIWCSRLPRVVNISCNL